MLPELSVENLQLIEQESHAHPEDPAKQFDFYANCPFSQEDSFSHLKPTYDPELAAQYFQQNYNFILRKFPRLKDYREVIQVVRETTNYYYATNELWRFTYAYSHACKLFPSLNQSSLLEYDPNILIKEFYSELNTVMADKKFEGWTLTPSSTEDPLVIGQRMSQVEKEYRQEQISYQEAQEILQDPQDWSHYIYRCIADAGSQDLLGQEAVPYAGMRAVDLRGHILVSFNKQDVPFPIHVKRFPSTEKTKTRADQRDKEIQFVQTWRYKDFQDYLHHSSLQTVKVDENGNQSIWMLDLSRLGFVNLSELLQNVNLHTPQGREFFLASCLEATFWLNKIAQFACPKDHFPKDGFLINPFSQDPLTSFRTYDYGSFQAVPNLTSFNESSWNSWFSEHLGHTGVIDFSPLAPLITMGFQDSALTKIGFYGSMSKLMQKGPASFEYSELVEIFRKSITKLKALDQTKLGYPDKLDQAISPLDFVSETLSLLPIAELKFILQKEKEAASLSPLASDYYFATLIKERVTKKPFIANQLAARYGVSTRQALDLVGHLGSKKLVSLIKQIYQDRTRRN